MTSEVTGADVNFEHRSYLCATFDSPCCQTLLASALGVDYLLMSMSSWRVAHKKRNQQFTGGLNKNVPVEPLGTRSKVWILIANLVPVGLEMLFHHPVEAIGIICFRCQYYITKAAFSPDFMASDYMLWYFVNALLCSVHCKWFTRGFRWRYCFYKAHP
jgi:hypothetical protein